MRIRMKIFARIRIRNPGKKETFRHQLTECFHMETALIFQQEHRFLRQIILFHNIAHPFCTFLHNRTEYDWFLGIIMQMHYLPI